MSLGRGTGFFQFASMDDRANPLYLGGRPGAKLKEIVCRATVKQLVNEARRSGPRPEPGKAPATAGRTA